jgi:hypothetical protein
MSKTIIRTRAQKGHSIIRDGMLLGVFTMWMLPLYWTFSPNHYWHA